MSLPFIHSFNNATTSNDILYADTSFIWESFGTSNGNTPPRQTECHNFSTNAVKNGSVFVISPIIEQELRNVALKELLKHHAPLIGAQPFHRKKIISNVPNIMADAHNHVDQIMQILGQDPNYVILDEDAKIIISKKLSSTYNMDLNDSIILGTMLTNEITSIVTLDGDYIDIHDQNIQIYTNESNYLKILRNSANKVANSTPTNIGNSNSA